MLSSRKEGRKNDQLGFSVASVEIANGDCPEPLDRGLGILLVPVMHTHGVNVALAVTALTAQFPSRFQCFLF